MLCPDDLLADHLTRKAAEYHEKALRSEFEADLDADDRHWCRAARAESWQDGAVFRGLRTGESAAINTSRPGLPPARVIVATCPRGADYRARARVMAMC